VVLSGSPLELSLKAFDLPTGASLDVTVLLDGEPREQVVLGQQAKPLQIDSALLSPGRHTIEARSVAAQATAQVRVLRGWLSVLPPLIAIGLALAFRDVLLSLFLGVFSGALFLAGLNPFVALARSVDTYVAPSLANPDHASILIFSTLLGGMVGVISKSGGTQGIVDRLSRYATTPRRGQLATWCMGIMIFFDDYANTLIVGSTMRPITDRLKVSREKLAYIVDSTAAPVACIVPISTWIGFEIGLIAAAFSLLDLPFNAYGTFIATLPYVFYPIFALVLGFAIAYSGYDFGPMKVAEQRARETGKLVADGDTPLSGGDARRLDPPEGAPRRAINALAPIATVVLVTLVGLYITGEAEIDRAAAGSTFEYLRDVFASSNSFTALLWGSLGGATLAMALALAQRILTVRQATGALVEGFRSMLLAIVVLLLAWSIGAVCEDLKTANYVVGLAQGVLSPRLLPVLTFLISAGIAFATGASWGAMAIILPIVIPISDGLSTAAGFPVGSETYFTLMIGTIASVLAGSVWGDHCSPISDTTILTSMASGCDHIAHVRTQMPYALAIGFLGMLVGNIPTAYGMSPWISLLAGGVIIVAGVYILGRAGKRRAMARA